MDSRQSVPIDKIVDQICSIPIIDSRSTNSLNSADSRILAEAAKICSQILRCLLISDLTPELPASKEVHLDLLRFELQNKLIQFVGTNSAFWEKYYERKHFAHTSKCHEPITSLEEDCLGTAARSRFNAFYTILDAVHYTTGGARIDYELLLQSRQCYLKGQFLMLQGNTSAALHELGNALQLMGVRKRSEYNEHLTSLMEQYS